jgi:hypothetical protein
MADVSSTDGLHEKNVTLAMQAENEADTQPSIEILQDDQNRIKHNGFDHDKYPKETTNNPFPNIDTKILNLKGNLIIEVKSFRLLILFSVFLLFYRYFRKIFRKDSFVKDVD